MGSVAFGYVFQFHLIQRYSYRSAARAIDTYNSPFNLSIKSVDKRGYRDIISLSGHRKKPKAEHRKQKKKRHYAACLKMITQKKVPRATPSQPINLAWAPDEATGNIQSHWPRQRVGSKTKQPVAFQVRIAKNS